MSKLCPCDSLQSLEPGGATSGRMRTEKTRCFGHWQDWNIGPHEETGKERYQEGNYYACFHIFLTATLSHSN